VLKQGLRLTVLGVLLGLTMSLVLTRFLGGMLYGVSATDPLTVLVVVGVLVVTATAAIYLPTAKAMRTDPVRAIRGQ
jgi:ABC-type antimicrobial peptide transport system permease subunit